MSSEDKNKYNFINLNRNICDEGVVITNRFFFNLFKIEYFDKLGCSKPYNVFKSDNKKNRKHIIECLLKKDLKYSIENEYRGMIIDKIKPDCNVRFSPKTLKLNYPDKVLSEIIFGKNCTDATRKEIVQIVTENYSEKVPFYEIIEKEDQLIKKVFEYYNE